ncbi:MAG: Maf family protein [Candidatus Theseobacter exili]|nr:Maf family protein [Candidatus Theseobacter exili]
MALHEIFENRKIVLASRSPRRRMLLDMIGLSFDIDPANVPEDIPQETKPSKGAESIAVKKALATAQRYENAMVIGADTIVVLDSEILGKPANKKDAFSMLSKLSGRTHEVFTGFAVVLTHENKMFSGVERTAVTFRNIRKEEIDGYIATNNPMDKAGAYGIQDVSAVFVRKIDGCFYNVVGFPLTKFYEDCHNFLSKIKE